MTAVSFTVAVIVDTAIPSAALVAGAVWNCVGDLNCVLEFAGIVTLLLFGIVWDIAEIELHKPRGSDIELTKCKRERRF